MPSAANAAFGTAARVLVLGIGGGGDVVGALAVGRQIERLGTEVEVGGVSWERFAVDPHPGPRRLEELSGIARIAPAAALAGAEASTPEGVRICEGGMARHLGRDVALIDIHDGPAAIAEGIVAACGALRCDLVVLCDVGGDVLAGGGEPGLASPLCDALLLASAAHLPAGLPAVGSVIGAGCDGELTAEEVLERVAALALVGGWIGADAIDAEIAAEIEAAARLVPTEASLQAARCARGEVGPTPIRGGRRIVELGPIGALTFHYDPLIAIGSAAPLAAAVERATSLTEAQDALASLGVRTELDYERERAAEAAGG